MAGRVVLISLILNSLVGFSRSAGVPTEYWSSCKTPVNKPGQCVLVAECDFIRRVLDKPLLGQNDIRYIEASRCGSYDRKALVCCAEPSGTPPNSVPTTSEPIASRVDSVPSSAGDKLKLLPKNPSCGIQYSDRIVGGERTKIDEFPWTARIQHYDQRYGEFGFHCGGSLISELYVLTAAHCIIGIPKAWTVNAVRLGEWNTVTNPDCIDNGNDCYDPVQDINVAKITPHENFINTKTEVHNDIALLRLAQKAVISETVVPICLPLDTSFSSRRYDTQRMFVAGWGQTETERGSQYKLFVAVNGVPMDSCRQQYPSAKIDERQICAGGEQGKDSCRGDSGGPLMDVVLTQGSPVYYLAGVVSYGRQCGLDGVPGVYTKVNRFGEWILNHIEP